MTLIPRSKKATLGTWRTNIARDAAGYLALVGGRALAVDLAQALGVPAKAVRHLLSQFPKVFQFTHENSVSEGRDYLVVMLCLGPPRDLQADIRHRSPVGGGKSGVNLTVDHAPPT